MDRSRARSTSADLYTSASNHGYESRSIDSNVDVGGGALIEKKYTYNMNIILLRTRLVFILAISFYVHIQLGLV